MYKSSEGTYKQERQKPSFAFSLLDEVYRSIMIEDAKDGIIQSQDLKFYPDMNLRKSQITAVSEEGRRNMWKEIQQEKNRLHDDQEQDALSFSSAPNSSDTRGFSSPSVESLHGLKPKRDTTEMALFQEHKDDDYHYNAASYKHPKPEHSKIKSNSRVCKFCSSLKKIRQAISPRGRLKSLLDKMFSAGHREKSKHPLSVGSLDDVRAENVYSVMF